ncbi:MAG: ankyrin repeat domain-containing protein [Armatimonadota bacterium]
MLWFRKDKDRKKRRRSSSSKNSRGAERWDSGDRKSRAKRSSSRTDRRSTRQETRGTRREDTRDRDERKRERQRDRTVAKEQEEIFAALNYDDAPAEPDGVDRAFGRVLAIALALIVVLLVAAVTIHAVDRRSEARRAAQLLPLQNAAAEGDLDRLRSLTNEGLPVDGIGPDGGTALQSAIRAGELETTRLLLDLGAEPSDDAVRMAMRYERWDILSTLIDTGGNPEVRAEWSGRSPLELAVERGDMEMIRLLLAHGADPSAVSNEGPSAQPALHYAAENGMREVVELLLEHGADPGRLWMGYQPRHLAEDAGHDEVAELLAEAERTGDGASAGVSE